MFSSAARLKLEQTVSESGSAPGLQGKQRAIFCLALVALTLIFYNPIAHNGFVLLDDVPYILGNPPVQAGLTWATVKWSFTTFQSGYWHPLTWLSHALDCQLFGLNPAGHHYVSLLFHAANAVLLFLLLAEATALTWPSLLVAALFAVHPINVESVAWAAERKNVLSMFFFLLALWEHVRYALRGGKSRYGLVVLFFVLGLMAKPQVITLPFVLLLFDYWPLQRMFSKPANGAAGAPATPRSFWSLVAEKTPLFAIALVSSILTIKAQRSVNAVHSLADYSLAARLQNAVVSYGSYLANLFWPHRLAPLHPYPENSLPQWQVAACSLALALLTAVVLYFKNRRYLAMGWLWFLGVLVPMIGIVQAGEQAMADRFAYIPMIGIMIAVVWSAWDIAVEKKISLKFIGAITAVPIVALGALTYHQLGYWKDAETLWRYTLSVTPENYMAHQSLAMALDQQGRVEEAIREFNAAEALHQFPLSEVLGLGIYEQRNQHMQDALGLYQKVLRDSDDPKLRLLAWSQSGSANAQMKQYDQASLCFDRALQISANDPASLVGSALLAGRSGDFSREAELLTRAVKVEPNDVTLLLQAEALRMTGQPEQAQSAEEAARIISPDRAQAAKKTAEMQAFFGLDSRFASRDPQLTSRVRPN